jgi:hypothetical protein
MISPTFQRVGTRNGSSSGKFGTHVFTSNERLD